ncbi:MAG: hypothetical protein WD063_19920 [Pirellulales bacterium]
MGSPITKEVAVKALKKLGAVDISEKSDAHPTYAIYYEKRIVATTGLRRSSKKDIPLPHLKNDLRVNAGFVLELARCTKYFVDWLVAVKLVVRGDKSDPETPGSSK